MSDSSNPMDCSPPGSSFQGIFQARILVWVAISFSRWSSQPRDRTWVFCIVGRFFTTEPSEKPTCILKMAKIFLYVKKKMRTFLSLSFCYVIHLPLPNSKTSLLTGPSPESSNTPQACSHCRWSSYCLLNLGVSLLVIWEADDKMGFNVQGIY